MPTTLLCTLGASWAVIPEIWGWLAPATVDLYAHHPEHTVLETTRARHGLDTAPDELWICTTGGQQTHQGIATLQQWWRQLGTPAPLRIWVAEGTDQLANEAECARMRELIFRAALAASSRGDLIVSLAGGRKTMSADLQDAASVFGARAWLHVVGPEPLPSGLRDAAVDTFLSPLPCELARAVMPLVAGSGMRSEFLDVAPALTCAGYPLPLPVDDTPSVWRALDGADLHAQISQRRSEGGRLLSNFVADVARQEDYENWRSLYRLAPRDIEQLRNTRLGPQHLGWLQALPKADLHRHLGGCLSVAAQQTVAQAIWDASCAPDRDTAMRLIAPLLDQAHQRGTWPDDWPRHLRTGQRALNSAALLLNLDTAALERHLYAPSEPRVALKQRHKLGFAAYERPGELSGSALLAHPAAIAPYANALVQQARTEGLAWLELRGSPQKYRAEDPASFLHELEAALIKAGARTRAVQHDTPADNRPRIGFVWILDRRQRTSMAAVIQQAITALGSLDGFLLGLDLAGDEGTQRPEELARDFDPAFKACMPITIHAGEGESADNIWQAAYHLHADRIGHGLTLVDHPQLAQRFRDRHIALELCPTSNREVVGFFDPAHPASADCPYYPLRRMMTAGLPLTLCTDNPGISRTTLADEYLAASRMTDGITLWESLALIRNGFAHSMAKAQERDSMLRQMEGRVASAQFHASINA